MLTSAITCASSLPHVVFALEPLGSHLLRAQSGGTLPQAEQLAARVCPECFAGWIRPVSTKQLPRPSVLGYNHVARPIGKQAHQTIVLLIAAHWSLHRARRLDRPNTVARYRSDPDPVPVSVQKLICETLSSSSSMLFWASKLTSPW